MNLIILMFLLFCLIHHRGNIGELYFNAHLLRSWSGSSSQSISNYEKIKTLGRGRYTYTRFKKN